MLSLAAARTPRGVGLADVTVGTRGDLAKELLRSLG